MDSLLFPMGKNFFYTQISQVSSKRLLHENPGFHCNGKILPDSPRIVNFSVIHRNRVSEDSAPPWLLSRASKMPLKTGFVSAKLRHQMVLRFSRCSRTARESAAGILFAVTRFTLAGCFFTVLREFPAAGCLTNGKQNETRRRIERTERR
jgi:hypothetical protein